MGNIIVTNNATGELSAGINDTVTSVVLKSGEGALFPNPTGTEYFYITISDSAGNIEICKCTARSTNTLTVVRGADNSTAQAWDADDNVSLRLNAIQYENFAQLDGDNVSVGDWDHTGAFDVTGAATVSSTLDVTGVFTADSTVDINGNTTIDGTCDITGNSTLTGTFDVVGNTTVTGTFDVTGAATVSTTLGVTTNATVGGTFGVTGVTELDAVLTVNEDVILNSVSTRKYHELHRADGLRWRFGHDLTAESGSDVGTDFELDAVDDAGTTASNVFTIARATQVIDFAEYPTVAGAALPFPAGTSMLFYDATAPTGWTAESINDKAIRVVSSGGTGGTDGGTTAFSSVLTSWTLTEGQLPSHTHGIGTLDFTTTDPGTHRHTQTTYNTTTYGSSGLSGVRKNTSSGNTGYAGAHTHSVSSWSGALATTGSGTAIDHAIQYSDVIIATKD